MSWTRLRPAASIAAVLAAAALGIAIASERYGGLVPCALCLWERWPYRVAIALGIAAALLPHRARLLGRVALGLLVATVLVGAGLGFVHVGVEQGWWPSPLPECAAPNLGGGSIAERLARMPARPSKPCDEPTYLVPGIPVSMAGMNFLLSLALAGFLLIPITRPKE